MKKHSILLIILFSLFLTGCRPVLRLIYGVKPPQYETVATIEQFKNDVFGKQYPFLVLNWQSWADNKLLPLPEVFVFDHQELFIPYKDTLRPNCNGPAEVFLAELDAQRNYHFDTSYTMKSFLSILELPGCGSIPEIEKQETDFYIFFTWANYSGKKIYKQKTLEWIKSVEANQRIRNKIFMINQDIQDCWSKEQKKKFE